MDDLNYYEVLNISKNASKNEIKKAYKKLVKKYHPDLYKGDKNFAEQKIKQINEAYETLSDVNKKLEYDTYLSNLENPTITYSDPITNHSNNKQYEPTPVTNFFSKKLEHLSGKRQLQIFILVFFITLLVFLINLIWLKDYLSNTNKEKITKPTNITNSTNRKNSLDRDYPAEKYNSIDDFLYDYLNSYFK